jgi:hypothetical protein
MPYQNRCLQIANATSEITSPAPALTQEDVYRFLKIINPPEIAIQMAAKVTDSDLRLMEKYIFEKHDSIYYHSYLDEALLLIFTSL